MTSHQIDKGFIKAQNKANKFNAPTVLRFGADGSAYVSLLRSYSPARQAAIRIGNEGEYLLEPNGA